MNSPEPEPTNRSKGLLPGRWIDMLRDGDVNEDYGTPHGACMAYAIRASRAGHTLDDYLRDLGDPRNSLGDYYRKRDDRGARKRHAVHQRRLMGRDWAKATRYAADHPQVLGKRETYQRLAEIRAAVHAMAWPGRSGLRNKTVMLALLDIGVSLGTITPQVSVRGLAEDTSFCGSQAIIGALKALRASGWATPDRRDMPRTEASRYRLDTPPRPVSDRSKKRTALPVGGSLAPVGDSAGETAPSVGLGMALGIHAAAVHAALCVDVARPVPELVSLSGVSRPSVYRWLPRLEGHGLAVRSGDGWLRGDGSPADVAADLGVDGKVKRRAERHELQRAGFHAWVEARSADTERKGKS